MMPAGNIFSGALAPAGSFSSLGELCAALQQLRTSRTQGGSLRGVFRQRLSEVLGASDVLLAGSGKVALYSLFSTLRLEGKRSTVLLADYTCPDVATAALRAGLRVMALPVDPSTLEIDMASVPSTLDPTKSILVLSNLYGLPDNLTAWSNLQKQGLVIIDDGCQSCLSRADGAVVGCRPGTLGVVSFGRGKAICGVGGGALVVPKDFVVWAKRAGIDPIAFQATLTRHLSTDRTAPAFGNFSDGVKSVLATVLTQPLLYQLIRKLPGLHLGETHVRFDFPLAEISASQLVVAYAQLSAREHLQRLMLDNARSWSAVLADIAVDQPLLRRGLNFGGETVPTRYPLVVADAPRCRSLYERLDRMGLGASLSYPRTLSGYPELSERIERVSCAAEADVSNRLITLPVHSFLSRRHTEIGAGIMREVLG